MSLSRIGFWMLITISVTAFVLPQASAYRTLASCGDGSGHTSDFKPGARWAQNQLDDEWQHTVTPGGRGIAHGAKKDEDLSNNDLLKAIWHTKQSQVIAHLGHGDKVGITGYLHLDGSDLMAGFIFTEGYEDELGQLINEKGNWKQGGIPGSIYGFFSCNSGDNIDEGICKSARDGGARYALGTLGHTQQRVIAKYEAKEFASKVSSSSRSLSSVASATNNAAYWGAINDHVVFTHTPDLRYYYWTAYIHQKIGKEYDYDNAPTSFVSANTWKEVGGVDTGVGNEDGAWLYFNCYPQHDGDTIKVQYKEYPEDSWHNKGPSNGEYDIKQLTYHDPNDLYCAGQDIVLKFGDHQTSDYLKVQIKNKDGWMYIYNFKLTFMGEANNHA